MKGDRIFGDWWEGLGKGDQDKGENTEDADSRASDWQARVLFPVLFMRINVTGW
jgi:hypothetical protein